MRPSVPSPTGTWIDAPELITAAPRTSPSVEPIARQRTWLLPSSTCTSRTSSRDCIAVPPSSMPVGTVRDAVGLRSPEPPTCTLERVVDVRQRLGRELDVDDVAENLDDLTGGLAVYALA